MTLSRRPKRRSYYLCALIIPILLLLYILNVFLKPSSSGGTPIKINLPELPNKIIPKEDNQEKFPNDITLSDDCKK